MLASVFSITLFNGSMLQMFAPETITPQLSFCEKPRTSPENQLHTTSWKEQSPIARNADINQENNQQTCYKNIC